MGFKTTITLNHKTESQSEALKGLSILEAKESSKINKKPLHLKNQTSLGTAYAEQYPEHALVIHFCWA